MANIGKWNTPTAAQTILSAGLNSLASSAMASAIYTNSSNLDIYCDVEVLLASLSPVAGAYVSIYAQEAIDGTNYPAQSAADLRLTSTQLLVVIPIGTTGSTAQRVVARNVVLPPAAFNVVLDNQTGTALNASGNTVKFLVYDINGNG